MKGCPHCNDFKDMLSENDVLFYEHDIDEHKEEYDMSNMMEDYMDGYDYNEIEDVDREEYD